MRINRSLGGPAAEHQVITVISDDDDDTELLPAGRRATAQQHASSQEVDLTHDEPGPRTRAATATAAAANSPKRTPTKKSPKKQTPLKAAAAAAAAAAGQTGADSDGDDSGSSCIICMELMAEQGGHRPAALKCGHIFGENCIKRWLKEKSRCPQCNKQARVREITALFNLPKKVAAGRGESAAALEHELQEAQKKAKQEQERARLLEQQLERANRELARQQRQQQQQQSRHHSPPRRHEPQRMQQQPRMQQYHQPPPPPPPPPPPRYQQPHMAYWLLPPSGTLPGLPMTYAVQADSWSCSVFRLMQGQHLSDAEMAAFLHHPNTALYFGPQFSSIMLQQQGLQGPQVGQHAAADGQQQQQQQQQQQVLQVHRQALQAAMAGRKRTMEQSKETDAGAAGGLGAAAAGGAGGGGSSLSALPAAAAAAAAAEARAQAGRNMARMFTGSGGPGPQHPLFADRLPGADISSAGSLGSSGAPRKHVVQLSLLPVERAAAADGTAPPSQQQQEQQTQVQVAAAAAFPAEYVPAQQFSGPREGYVFELGPKGLGYYRDAGPFMLTGRTAAGSLQQQQQQRVLQMPGSFSLLQEYELTGSRAFDLDVEGTLLTVAEAMPNFQPGYHRLRRVSMLAPGTPMYISLQHPIGAVRCLARQPQASASSSSSSALMAVATDKAGLIIAKPSTNNIIATVPTQAPVWSVAWSHRHEQQLILGLDKGRLAVVDLRMTGSRALLLMTSAATSSSIIGRGSGGAGSGVTWLPAAAPTPAPAAATAQPPPLQPWHSLVMLPRGGQQQHAEGMGEDWATPEALLACTAGVYCWSSAQPDSFQQLLPASLHGGTCEGLALAPDGSTIAASFRRPIVQQLNGMNDIQPEHWLARLQPAPEQPSATAAVVRLAAAAAVGSAAAAVNSDQAGGSAATSIGNSLADAVSTGRQALATSTLRLTGHSSMQAMTHGCFLPALPDMPSEQLLFASADEGSREPRLWGCSSGAGLLQRQPWQAMSTPVLQLAGGRAAAFDTMLLGVLSERQLKLYSYACG